VRDLRREVRELREARGGIATVRGAAEGRRFLSASSDEDSDDGDPAAAPARPAAATAISDDEAARMAAFVAAARTGGMAVVGEAGSSSSGSRSGEESGGGDDEESGGGEDKESDGDDALDDALFSSDDRLSLVRPPPPATAASSAPPSPRVVSPTPAGLAARWREAERARLRSRRSGSSPSGGDDGEDDDEEDAGPGGGAAADLLRAPAGAAAPAAQIANFGAARASGVAGAGAGGAPRMTLEEFRALPEALFLVRHAESVGNADMQAYSNAPDYDLRLSERGLEQATQAGNDLRDALERRHGPGGYRVFFYVSPYCRTRQTFVAIRQAFEERCFAGLDEDINLREQEFSGGLQTPSIRKDLEERLRYGRFFYRFPQGESTADVYLRQCVFEDQLLRSLRSGRHGDASHVVIVGHGIALRVLLMRLLGWTVESFLQAHNPPNAAPLAIEKISEASFLRLSSRLDARGSLQIRQCYRLSQAARASLRMDIDPSSSTMDLLQQQFT
jgi:broad specificity phosphatase PhoE